MHQNICQCETCLSAGVVCYTEPDGDYPICDDCENGHHGAIVALDRVQQFNANGNNRITFGGRENFTNGAEHGC